MRVARSHV
ncbi:hypothetical protein D030_1945A, partial [Vibrio parahaemolyticus AQ3810]